MSYFPWLLKLSSKDHPHRRLKKTLFTLPHLLLTPFAGFFFLFLANFYQIYLKLLLADSFWQSFSEPYFHILSFIFLASRTKFYIFLSPFLWSTHKFLLRKEHKDIAKISYLNNFFHPPIHFSWCLTKNLSELLCHSLVCKLQTIFSFQRLMRIVFLVRQKSLWLLWECHKQQVQNLWWETDRFLKAHFPINSLYFFFLEIWCHWSSTRKEFSHFLCLTSLQTLLFMLFELLALLTVCPWRCLHLPQYSFVSR